MKKTGDENLKEEPLLIKRYASRRLYNSETSDYVTIHEIANFIGSGRDVQIVDLKSGEDITRQYLIQIIAEREAKGEQILPIDVLTEIVRSYSDQATIIPDFLSASFGAFQLNQQSLIDGFKKLGSPIVSVKEMQDKQREFFQRMMGGWVLEENQREEMPRAKESENSSSSDEIESIKKQLAALQSKVEKL